MLQVTERASQELSQVLGQVEKQPEQTLRLVSDPQAGYRLTLDVEQEGDQVVEHQGSTVLVLSSDLARDLEGAVLDVQETPAGPALTISRP